MAEHIARAWKDSGAGLGCLGLQVLLLALLMVGFGLLHYDWYHPLSHARPAADASDVLELGGSD